MRLFIPNILISLLILILGCDDEITYQSEFQQDVFLYCIINADSGKQYAVLEKSYEDNKDQSNHFIENAAINLSSQYETVSLISHLGDGINLPLNYYSTENFKPSRGSTIGIEAVLEDGNKLSSTITLPQFSLFFFDLEELNIPFNSFTDDFKLNWNIKNKSTDIAFLATMYIDYNVTENNIVSKNRIEVPSEYKSDGKKLVPIYNAVTNLNFVYFNQSTINKTMELIAGSDTARSKYQIIGGTVELFILEENLATYFASSETFKNTYSVKLFETIVSNIDGGKGIFGAYMKRELPLNISQSYIKSFGYSTN